MTMYDGANNPSTTKCTLTATSNVLPSPQVCSANSSQDSARYPYRAFDLDAGTNWQTGGSASYGPWTLMVDLGSGREQLVNKYKIAVANTSDFSPKSWVLQGSNTIGCTVDDTKNANGWTDLDTRISASALLGTFITFSCDTLYRYFRIYITETSTYGPTVAGWAGTREITLVAQVIPILADASESSTSTDDVSGFIAITADISESLSTTDQIDGTKDREIADVVETSSSTDPVDVYQDYSICDVSESPSSSDSNTSSVGGDVDVVESFTSTDAVAVFDTIITDVVESFASEDTTDSANHAAQDITGTLAVITEMSIFDVTGVQSGTGSFAGVTGSCKCFATGAVGASGRFAVVSAVVDSAMTGLVDAVGGFVGVTETPAFGAVGLVDNIGTANLVTSLSTFAGTGLEEIQGVLAATTAMSVLAATGRVDSTGVMKIAASPFLFFGKDNGNAVVTSYCLNLLKKGLVSTFTNFDFNSFAEINGVMVGGKSSGMFKLTGDVDVSSTIDATIEFPLAKFGVDNVKQLRAVKLFGRSDGSLLITANDGKSGEWEVPITLVGDDSAESVLGYFPFTARGRYLQLKVENVAGCDFLLDKVDLSLYVLGRA